MTRILLLTVFTPARVASKFDRFWYPTQTDLRFYLQAPRAAYGPVAGTTDTCSTQVGPGLSRGGGADAFKQ